MQKFLTLVLAATLALQFPTTAFADSVAPAASPTPIASPLPNAPFTATESPPQSQAMKWVNIGVGVVALAAILFDHRGGCVNNNDASNDDALLTDALPRRPAIGLTVHFAIP